MLLELDDDITEEKKRSTMLGLVGRLLSGYKRSEVEAQALIRNVSVAPATVGKNGFPVASIDELLEIAAPSDRLAELVQELCSHGDYSRIRDEYCQCSILINLEEKVAPAFRPTLVTGKKHGSPVFLAIHRDQLVIDCHWLHVTKEFVKVRDKDVEFASMFQSAKPFPFELAWRFANKKWGANHRALDMLRLTDYQQCQLAGLWSDELKARIIGLTKGCRKDGRYHPSPLALFERGLSAWCERDKRIMKHRDGYLAVWKARSFLGKSASVRQIGQLVALMLGEAQKDDKTIRSREENIHRHILGS